jgi:hypothetical protein
MAKAINIVNPAYWISAFVFNELKQYEDVGVDPDQQFNPIIPSDPVGFNEIWTYITDNVNAQNPILIQYDTLLRYRSQPFYRIKKEQLVYDLTCADRTTTINAVSVITQLLDREDAAAEDINRWAAANASVLQLPYNVYFHRVKVYRVDESRDLVELNSINIPNTAAKIIVEYDYHSRDGETFTPQGESLDVTGKADYTTNRYD